MYVRLDKVVMFAHTDETFVYLSLDDVVKLGKIASHERKPVSWALHHVLEVYENGARRTQER